MGYQYAKDNTVEEKENGAFNPYKIFLPRFVTDLKPSAPRRRPAFNFWRQTKRTEINQELQVQVERAKADGNPILPSHFAARREAIARAMYKELDDDDKKHWENISEEQHELAMIQHNQQQDEKISTAPADRQRWVNSFSRVPFSLTFPMKFQGYTTSAWLHQAYSRFNLRSNRLEGHAHCRRT